MKSQKNLIISFLLGLLWIAVVFIYSIVSSTISITGIVPILLIAILLTINALILVFAVRSILKQEAIVGPIIVILADMIILMGMQTLNSVVGY